MSKMIAAITDYLQKSDAIGFWVECDGVSISARKLTKEQREIEREHGVSVKKAWEVTIERWNGINNTYSMSVNDIVECLQIVIRDDDHATYKLFEPATKWSINEVERFMAGLCPTMCKPYYKGFTLSADGVETFVVEKFPFDFVTWRINGEPADFSKVLQATRAKLAENVMWKHTEI